MALAKTVLGIYGKKEAGTAAFSTEEFTPPANSLLVVRVYMMRNSGESEMGQPTISGGGLTWTARTGATTTLKPTWSTKAVWFTAPVGGSPAKMAITVDDLNNLNIYEYSVSVIAFTGYDTTTPIGGILGSGTTNIADGEESRELSEAPASGDMTLLSIDCDASKGPPKPSLETGWESVHELSPSGESGVAIAVRSASTSKTVKVKDVYTNTGGFSKGGIGALVVRAAAGGPQKITATPATETDSAIAPTIRKRVTATPATEADTAGPAGPRRRVAVVPAAEADSAIARTIRKLVRPAPATETDAAIAPSVRRRTPVTPALEVDIAIASPPRRRVAVTPGLETDTATARTIRKLARPAPAAEVDVAIAAKLRKLVRLVPALEVDVAVARGFRRRVAIAPGLEVDTAIAPRILKVVAVTPALEVDVAIAPGISQAEPAGPSLYLSRAQLEARPDTRASILSPLTAAALADVAASRAMFEVQVASSVTFALYAPSRAMTDATAPTRAVAEAIAATRIEALRV